MREHMGPERTNRVNARRRYVFKRKQIEEQYRPERLRKGCAELNARHPYAQALSKYAEALHDFKQLCSRVEWSGKWAREYARVERWSGEVWIPSSALVQTDAQLALPLHLSLMR